MRSWAWSCSGTSRAFPSIPGQKFGAALFPGVISAGLVICGLLLARARHPAAHARRCAARASTTGHAIPCTVVRFLSVPAGLLFYVLTSDFLGFHIAAALAMLAWLLVFGMKPLPALALAIVFPVVMHLAFYKILLVPLPWGVLTHVVFP